MAEILSRFIQVSRSCNDTLQCLESLTSALDILGKIPPTILTLIQPLISVLHLEEANISLRYEYEKSCRELNKIGYHVMEFIDILKSISEMADDNNRMQGIFAEIKNQGEAGTTHFNFHDLKYFPKLNDFLTELIAWIDQAKNLSETIENQCEALSTRNKVAETEASNQENVAKRIKLAFRTVTVSLTIAVGGLGLATIFGRVPAVVGAASIGGGCAGISLSFMVSKEFLHKEEKFQCTKEKFKRLNQAASHLQDITRKSLFSAQGINNDLKVKFIRKNPPLLTRIRASLDKLLEALKFEKMNFDDMRKEAEMIADATKVEFQLMPVYISCVEDVDIHTSAIQSDKLSTDTLHEIYPYYFYRFISPQYHMKTSMT